MSQEQYVVFKLGEEEYGLNIMNVTEIITFEETVKLPTVPRFVEGVINYRGTIISIICLKKRFNIPSDGVDHNTRIIILNISDKLVGFIVDEASETIRIENQDIDTVQKISTDIDIKYVDGIAKIDDRLIIIVDLDLILSEEEKVEIEELESL